VQRGVEAISPGDNVDDHRIEHRRFDCAYPGSAAIGEDHLEALELEHGPYGRARRMIAVDDENAGQSRHPRVALLAAASLNERSVSIRRRRATRTSFRLGFRQEFA
jgi:hypothetical protein